MIRNLQYRRSMNEYEKTDVHLPNRKLTSAWSSHGFSSGQPARLQRIGAQHAGGCFYLRHPCTGRMPTAQPFCLNNASICRHPQRRYRSENSVNATTVHGRPVVAFGADTSNAQLEDPAGNSRCLTPGEADGLQDVGRFRRVTKVEVQDEKSLEIPPDGPLPVGFPTTQWSRVLVAGGDELDSDQALEDLCRLYWPPLYTFLRRRGHAPHDAQDLTQGFLMRLLARADLGTLSPEKGRFRTYLLAGLRNYSIKQALADKAQKRGGGQRPLSIDTAEAERLCGPDLAAESPELAFDRRWCRTVLDQALMRLQDELYARGKRPMFEKLSPFLEGVEPGEYAGVAAELGMTTGALAVALHRMRARLQELVRSVVAETVVSPERITEELQHLLEVWRR